MCKVNYAVSVKEIVPRAVAAVESIPGCYCTISALYAGRLRRIPLDSTGIYGIIILTHVPSPTETAMPAARMQNFRPFGRTERSMPARNLSPTPSSLRASSSIPAIRFRSSTRCLRRVQNDEQPVGEAAKVFGFSRVSFYQAQAAFEGWPARLGPQTPGAPPGPTSSRSRCWSSSIRRAGPRKLRARIWPEILREVSTCRCIPAASNAPLPAAEKRAIALGTSAATALPRRAWTGPPL